jgi:hypothetical protein
MDELQENTRTYRLIIQRWMDLVLLSSISALIVIIFHPAVTVLNKKLAEWYPKSSNVLPGFPIPVLIFWFLITTFLWLLLIRLGGFRYRTISPKTILRYPPTWIFAFFGAVLYYWLCSLIWNTNRFDWATIGLSLSSFIPAIFVAILLDSLFSLRKHEWIQPTNAASGEEAVHSFHTLLQNPPAFIRWLNKESPIHSSDEDLFDLGVFARRVAMMLKATPLKTIGLVGSYGCGKSSIVNMVGEYLGNPERLHKDQHPNQVRGNFDAQNIISCKVHGWGLQKGTASEHILRSILATLSKSMDCLGLIRIPSDYQAALSNSGHSWLKLIATLSITASGPLEILRRLDSVLACTGQRMIIFLEDLDRNTTGSAYWKELASLLDRLKDLDNISFILAINQNSKIYDTLLRVCEHIEFVPSLPRAEVIECIKSFRDICFDKFTDTDIDSRQREKRDGHLGLKKTSQEYDVAAMLGIEVNDPITVITKLLNNPRALKYSLRHTWRSWHDLHGEIDFDNLLVARVIYTIAPEAFAFINEKALLMRNLATDDSSEYTRKRKEENHDQLTTSWQNIAGSWDRGSVDILINFLYPGWIKDQVRDNFLKGTVPQGVMQSEPTDYWIRLNKEKISPDEIPDQVVLHALHDWKENHDKAVYEGKNLAGALLYIDSFAGKFEQFGKSLTGSDVRALAEELFEIIRKEGGNLPKDAHYHGFIELLRLALDKPVEGHEDWILGEIRKAIPVSLRFANELYYYWRCRDHTMIYTKVQTPMVRKGFVEAARKVYENNSQALIDALDAMYMFSIYHFMIYYSEADGGGPGFNPAKWNWLINILLEAGEKHPQTIIPQIVTLVSEEASNFREGFSYLLNEERLNSLFREERSRVMKLLAIEIDTSGFDERDKNRIEFVRQEAVHQLLGQKGSKTSATEIEIQ